MDSVGNSNPVLPGWLNSLGTDNDIWQIVNHTLVHKLLPKDSQGIYMVRRSCTLQGNLLGIHGQP
jgi:hypothetical protein